MNRSFQIFKRELLAYFHSPVAYVFIIIFLIASTGSAFFLGNFYDSNQASLEIFFLFHPWLYLFLIPAIGMRLWSEEKRSGTIELLLTYPVSLTATVLSKYLAAWVFIAIALFLTFPMIWTVNFLGNPDNGTIFTGYLGSLLMAGAYLGITSCTSALTKNQVISFILSVITCLIFVLLGWGVFSNILHSFLPGWISDLVAQFSFTTHFEALRHGVIDSRDLLYFFSVIAFTLMLNIVLMNSQHWSYFVYSLALLGICLIAVNVIGFFLPLRIDVTEDRLYTVSERTQKILETLQDPVTLKFYFSKSNAQLPQQFKSYAQRVEELLEEYKQLSASSIKLEIFEPKPDTEEEEWAQKYGISQIALPSGESIYFGMVALMLDQEVTIPFFDLRRQEFLEYDISQSILKVSTVKIPKIGILSSLNLMGTPAYGSPQPAREWAFISELKKNFEIQNLRTTIEEIPDDITMLLLIHPQKLDERTEYALDQYTLRGGRLIVLLDPGARVGAQKSPRSQFGPSNPKSDLPKLLKNWGITYDARKVVGDLRAATQINAGKIGVIRYPLWMSLSDEALNTSNPITNQLESLFLVEAGALNKEKGSSVEFTPILQTSTDSGFVDGFLLQISQPDQIARDLKMDQKTKTLAALVKGQFETAFPEGQPAKFEKKQDQKKNKESEKPTPLKHEHLKQAKEANTILVIADVDFISDQFSVQKLNFLGQTLVQPTNDNLNFMLNAVEFLSGNDALMSIRSRGRFSRPFTKLVALEQKAQLRFQEEETELQKKLKTVQDKLHDLERNKDPKQKRLLTQEQILEIKKFRESEHKTRKRLREVRKILRQDIEALGHWLLALNLLLIPAFVGISGVISYRGRMRQRPLAKKTIS